MDSVPGFLGYSDIGVHIYVYWLPWDNPGMDTVSRDFMDTLT